MNNPGTVVKTLEKVNPCAETVPYEDTDGDMFFLFKGYLWFVQDGVDNPILMNHIGPCQEEPERPNDDEIIPVNVTIDWQYQED